MTYDDNAKRLACKVIGTVESNLDYAAINYSDPITVGIAQWYGVRAAAILGRMKKTADWVNVRPTLNNQLSTIPPNDTFWNTRYLTTEEGASLAPVLTACAAIQIDQLIKDLEDYRVSAVGQGMDPDGNTAAVIFYFSMYHQGPVYANEVVATVGASADLTTIHAGAIAHPVLGQYPDRYNTAKAIIEAGDVADVPTPDGTEADPVTGVGNGSANYAGNLAYIEQVGNALHVHYKDGQILQAYTDGRKRFIPQQASVTAPAPSGDGTPPATGSGEWVNPLPGGSLTSGYGPRDPAIGGAGFHYGLDLATPGGGAPGIVYAPCDLVVTIASDGLNATTGTCVKAHTPDGLFTFALYHMQFASLVVAAGDTITKGSKIGIEGATGNVTGRHLHVEIYSGNFANPWPPPYGDPMDPMPVFNSYGVFF